jgi:hypothetical protein
MSVSPYSFRRPTRVSFRRKTLIRRNVLWRRGAPQPYWTNLTDPTTLRACSARIFVFDLCADTPAACYGENQGRDNTALD